MVDEALTHVLSVTKGLIPGECGKDIRPSTSLELRNSNGTRHKWVYRYFTPDALQDGIPGFVFEITHPEDNLGDVLYMVNATRRLYTAGPMDIMLPNFVNWGKPEIQSFFNALPVSNLFVEKSPSSRRPSQITSLLHYLSGEILPDGRVSYPLPHLERLVLRDMDDGTNLM